MADKTYTPRPAFELRSTPKMGSEREILSGILHNLRAVVAWKVFGLDDVTAKRSVVPSATTLLGVVHHLAWVEAYWFQEVFAGDEVDYPFDWGDDPDAEFRMTDAHTVDGVLGVYERNVARSNEIIDAAADLDVEATAEDADFSLRWIVAHMIDETARHAGHMDIIREQLDGATGYLPRLG